MKLFTANLPLVEFFHTWNLTHMIFPKPVVKALYKAASPSKGIQFELAQTQKNVKNTVLNIECPKMRMRLKNVQSFFILKKSKFIFQ